ncbi:MAG: alpha-amylase C-terminal beta-sheet domain-containing protein [Elusimicrobiaceae bacterium]|nr:alpha-amylase C-terminal beta-sheet domain-containing protein [Elusimicrobiaceae bacterium]
MLTGGNGKICFKMLAAALPLAVFGCAGGLVSALQQSGGQVAEAAGVLPAARAGTSGSGEEFSFYPRPARHKRPRKDMAAVIMLQGFHWESHQTAPWWNVLAARAQEIGRAGFDMVWLPPSGQSASDEGYMPVQYYNQNSLYGTEAQLKAAIAALHSNNVLAIGDMVINHRVGSTNWADFTNPQWGPDAVCSDDEWPGAKGAKDSGDGFNAARDIDHSKEYVRKSIVKWMLWLRDSIGYDGWRYDYAKGYSGKYLAYYSDATSPAFGVGEIWTDLDVNNPDANRQRICDWMDSAGGRSSAFDFTTKGLLQYAVTTGEYGRLRDNAGKPAGLLGWWPAKTVTFVDNHDTGSSPGGGQSHWPFPAQHVMQGYAYILTHPGVPCVYWPHYFDWDMKDEINRLIKLRRAQAINAVSPVRILKAETNLYAALIGNNTVVKIGPADWLPGPDWKLAVSGRNYAVWVR